MDTSDPDIEAKILSLDSDSSFEEGLPPEDLMETNAPIDLDTLTFPANWNWSIADIKHAFRETMTPNELLHLSKLYQSLKFPPLKHQTSQGTTGKDLIQSKISDIYQRFITKVREEGGFVDLSFLSRKFTGGITVDNYFDKVYVLNLDRRPDRLKNMERRLRKHGIRNWIRFPAVDGVQSPHWEEWKHYTKSRMTRIEKLRYQRKAIASCGSWAILKSMYHLIRDAQKNNYERILVLQDDLLFHKNFVNEFAKVSEYIQEKSWVLLYLGATQHNWNHILTSKYYYHPNGTADGAFAVGIHSKLYEELINEILKFDMPVDSGALRTLQKKYLYQSFVLMPNLIIADIRDSDLRHSRDLNCFGKRFKWNVVSYDVDN